MVLPLIVLNRVYKSAFLSGTGYTFCHSDSGEQLGLLFCGQNGTANELCCSPSGTAACLLKHTVSDSKVKPRLSGTGHLFSQFCLEQGIVSISLERSQVPRHSAAHPHPKLRGVNPLPVWGLNIVRLLPLSVKASLKRLGRQRQTSSPILNTTMVNKHLVWSLG